MSKPQHNLPSTLSLIGMPGAGKSTVGVVLAKQTGHRFLDTDIDIQTHQGASLQDILEQQGYAALRAIEEKTVLSVAIDNAVVSTGGSVVYSSLAMHRLRRAGPVIYLEVPIDTLLERVSAAPARGIASDSAHSFADIYAERVPLYKKYADLTLSTKGRNPDTLADMIINMIRHY